jgi:DNA polymerase elongation subunit (family B)
MFYVVDKHVKQSTAKTEVVDYVIEQNLPIDKDYYINKQLAPPLERIFKVLNFNIATGRFNGKQVTFEGF